MLKITILLSKYINKRTVFHAEGKHKVSYQSCWHGHPLGYININMYLYGKLCKINILKSTLTIVHTEYKLKIVKIRSFMTCMGQAA